jgi:hypothetical protein
MVHIVLAGKANDAVFAQVSSLDPDLGRKGSLLPREKPPLISDHDHF